MSDAPPPPGDEPAPAPGPERSSTGLDPRHAAALAYVAWWITGALVVIVERTSPYVRFHAMQCLVTFGAIWAIGVSLWLMGFLLMFAARGALPIMTLAADVVWIAGIILWLICLFKAYTGERWKVPLAGDLAERLMGAGRSGT